MMEHRNEDEGKKDEYGGENHRDRQEGQRQGAASDRGVLVLYLGLGILFEYGMGIPMGFYNIPVVVIFLVALLVACFQKPKAALR